MLFDASPPRAPFDPHTLRAERLLADAADRALIARHVLAYVAAFAGDVELCEAAMAGHVTCSPGEPAALAAERQIRDLADAAESATLQLTGAHPRGRDVLCAVLDDEFLLDDYRRIVAVEQHQAFAEPATASEVAAHGERRRALAEQARARAERVARDRLEDLRLCRCGQDYGRHRRNTGREIWQPRDQRVCGTFTDVDTQPIGALRAELLSAAVRSWAARHDVAIGDTDTADAMRLLEQMRAADKSRGLPAGAALATAAATLDWGRPPAAATPSG